MDKFDQIIDDYKKKKLGVDEAVEKLCALDRENISDVEYTDGEAKEARKSAIEMINIHTANLRPTKSLGVRETESMAVGD